jgi:hypothetical protein
MVMEALSLAKLMAVVGNELTGYGAWASNALWISCCYSISSVSSRSSSSTKKNKK